jgi:hypothetical protein
MDQNPSNYTYNGCVSFWILECPSDTSKRSSYAVGNSFRFSVLPVWNDLEGLWRKLFKSHANCAATCSSESERASNRFWSAMICESCFSIVDCWRLLIPSSNPNSRSVQAASATTPPITNTFANDHLGFSMTIPIPTAKLATIAAVSNTKWGQKGSNEPEKNPLTYLYLIAREVGSQLPCMEHCRPLLGWCQVSH